MACKAVGREAIDLFEAGMDGGKLGGSDQEREAAFGSDQAAGDRQDGFEALDGAQRDHVESRRRERFGAGGEYIDVRQCKGAGNFAQECGLLVIGLDQGERERRPPQFDGDAGEAGARADVSQSRSHRRGHRGFRRPFPLGKQHARGEETFAEMARHDLFWIANRCQIDARVPMKQYIDVRRYTFEVAGR